MNDYDKHLATRLTKLAAAGSSGVAPISGPVPGAIYFEDGRVVFAECSRTPHPARLRSSFSSVLAGGEATVDAALELLSNRSTSGRFRPAARPPASTVTFDVADLLAEVARRGRLLHQMAGFTADSPLSRNVRLPAERVQVSAGQWALIIRAYPGSTPRGLAFSLGRSVFGTTSDIYRLMGLGLLTSGTGPVSEDLSFMDALTSEKGRTAGSRRRADS